MKVSIHLMKISFSFLFLALASVTMFAQPANDDCANAVALTLAADKASCAEVEGTTILGTASTLPDSVCSGTWFADDVFYSVDILSVTDGITIDVDFGAKTTDVIGIGMAIYTSCEAGAIPLQCFTSNRGIDNKVYIPQCELSGITDLVIRVWSGGSPTDDSGTFRICAYQGAPDDWKYYESFENGLANWDSYGFCDNQFTTMDERYTWRHAADGVANLNSTQSFTVNQAAPTACNGSAIFEPLTNPNGCGSRAFGYLESPFINVADIGDDVALNFNQSYADILSSYFVEYRVAAGADTSDWINLGEFNETVEGFLFDNEELRIPIHDLSGFDAMQFRFTFNSLFWYWSIDDVRLETLEANNMRANTNFFSRPPRVVPASQAEPVGFLVDVYNGGAETQTGVELFSQVFDEDGNLIYIDSLDYGTLPGDSLAENQPMPNTFLPSSEVSQTYTGVYTVVSNERDFDPADNQIQFNFATSDSTFANEDFPNRNFNNYTGLAPGGHNAGVFPSYSRGNIFYTPNGKGYAFSTATLAFDFGADGPEALTGNGIVVGLYKWENANGDSTIQAAERILLGARFIEFTSDMIGEQFLNIKLENINSADPNDPIEFENDGVYLLGFEYSATSDDAFFYPILGDAIDYSANVLRSQVTGNPRYIAYTGVPAFGDPLDAIDWDGFGDEEAIPLIQMNIQKLDNVSTEELSSNNNINLFPNPAVNTITLDLDLEKVFDVVEVQISDVAGKVVLSNRIENVQNKRVVYNLDSFTSGVYILKMNTQEGVKNLKFVVQK